MIKHISFYSGYGGAEFALRKANININTIGYSEIKNTVIAIFNTNHPNIKNYGDIMKINPEELPDFDLCTGGFPCQDVSIAGLRDLSKGRTNTVFKLLDIIRVKKPKYILLENVKGILSMLNGDLLLEIIRQLKNIGYAVSYQLLNSKEHGIPQNRERVFIACELGRQAFGFNPFPRKEELKVFVKDILEEEVDSKYYLTEKQISKGKERSKIIGKKLDDNINRDYGLCLCARNHKRGINDMNLICASRGRNPDDPSDRTPGIPTEQTIEFRDDGCSNCLTTVQKDNYVYREDKLRILTPRECFRLMGFLNDEIQFGDSSDSALYEAAGNGWDIHLVSKIFNGWIK